MNEAAPRSASRADAGQNPDDTRRRKVPGRLECALGLFLGLAGLFASRLGQLWVSFDVFSQFTLQFIILTLAFLIGFLARRARLLIAFLILVTGILGIGLWPKLDAQWGDTPTSPSATERALKVVTFNSWYDSKTPDEVEAEVRRLDGDVVALVEIGPQGRARLFANLKQQYPHQATCFDVLYCNLAILSKLPIVSTTARVMWEGPPLITAQLGAEAGNLTIYGVHTIRFPHSRAQFKQVNALAGLVAKTPGIKIVMGDFNATPFSRVTSTFADQTGLLRLTSLPSWPSRLGLPQVSIDHIFASPEIRPLTRPTLGEPAGSDHYPVVMTLAVPKQ